MLTCTSQVSKPSVRMARELSTYYWTLNVLSVGRRIKLSRDLVAHQSLEMYQCVIPFRMSGCFRILEKFYLLIWGAEEEWYIFLNMYVLWPHNSGSKFGNPCAFLHSTASRPRAEGPCPGRHDWEQWFPNKLNFAPQGAFGNVWKTLLMISPGVATCI